MSAASILNIRPSLVLAVWLSNAIYYRRNWWKTILPNFFEPVIHLLGLGFGLGAMISDSAFGVSYFAFIAPGLMAASTMQGASFESTYNVFFKMRVYKTYDSFLNTEASIDDIALGEIIWSTTRAAAYGLSFLLVLLGFDLFGVDVIQSWWVLAAPLVVLLIGSLFSALGLAMSALFTTMDYFAFYFTLFIGPLFMLSDMFFPVEQFPYGSEIAWCTPLYHGVRIMRDLFQGTVAGDTLVSFAWLSVVTTVVFFWAIRLVRKRLIK